VDQVKEFFPDNSATFAYTMLPGNAMYMQPKIKSYCNGSYTRLKVAVCKYPDGTIVLNDGKNCVVQRPEHDWERYCTKSAQQADDLLSLCKSIARPFVQLLSQAQFFGSNLLRLFS
jgi:hypothetical protein